jgi:hypothetical protein
MSSTYVDLGFVFAEKGEFNKAVSTFKNAKGLLERLMEMNPDNCVLKEQINELNAIIEILRYL